MGEQHFFAESIFFGRGDDFGGDTGKFAVALVIGTIEDERNERGSSGNNFVTKLTGDVVAEGSGTHLGDRQASGGDDESGRTEFVAVGAQQELRGATDFGDARVKENLDVHGSAFGF